MNQFVAGNWSNGTVIDVALPPLPRPSNLTDVDAKLNEATRQQADVVLTIDASWSMPDEINGNLTGYDVYIGLEPLPTDLYATDPDSFEIAEELKVSSQVLKTLQTLY